MAKVDSDEKLDEFLIAKIKLTNKMHIVMQTLACKSILSNQVKRLR